MNDGLAYATARGRWVIGAAVLGFGLAATMSPLTAAVLAAVNAADVMRYAPDYLSYFTPFIKQSETWHYIGDSNLDWGQGLIALKKYQDEPPSETLYVRNTGGLDPGFYGIRYTPFDENEHPHDASTPDEPASTAPRSLPSP